MVTLCRRRPRGRHDAATAPRSAGRAPGISALLLPALGLLVVASTLLSACHSTGVSLVAQAPASQPCVDAHEALRQPIDGFSAAIGPGGRLALGSRIGPVFTLQRDAHGSVLPTKFLWLVKAASGTPVTLTARALKTNSLIDWVVTDPTTKTTSTTKNFRALVQPLDLRHKSKWGDIPSLLSIRTPAATRSSPQFRGPGKRSASRPRSRRRPAVLLRGAEAGPGGPASMRDPSPRSTSEPVQLLVGQCGVGGRSLADMRCSRSLTRCP